MLVYEPMKIFRMVWSLRGGDGEPWVQQVGTTWVTLVALRNTMMAMHFVQRIK